MGSAFTAIHLLAVVFAFFWLLTAFWMGFNFIDFASSWPTNFPGPSPWLFVWVPFAIGIIGFIAILGGVLTQRRMIFGNAALFNKPSNETDEDVEDYDSSRHSGYQDRSDLEIPDVCTKCEYALSREGLEWIGPLEFRCPYCGKVLQAKRR